MIKDENQINMNLSKMKKNILLLMLAMPALIGAQNVVTGTCQVLTSPDGAYRFTFYQRPLTEGNTQMCYSLTYKDRPVVEDSKLGLLIENPLSESSQGGVSDTCYSWCDNMKLLDTERRKVDEAWKPVYGERNEVRDYYNEMILKFHQEEEGKNTNVYNKHKKLFLNIVVRAYNEGVAFRYHFPKTKKGDTLHIVGERTDFTMPDGTMAYYTKRAQTAYELRPLEGWGKEESERPLTMKLPGGLFVSLLEAEMVDYARGKFRLSTARPSTLEMTIHSSVKIASPYSTPWRVVMVVEKPVDLINHNDILLNLNAPCQLGNTSWIKPGKAFRCGLKQAEVMAAIDFAAERGIQYVHMDAGWYGPEMNNNSDATTIAEDKDLDIPALCKYAETKKVGIFVYVNQRALLRQLDVLLPLYKKWGIKGIKFGFVNVGSQHWTIWLHDAVRKCAEYGMMVDIHDEYRPTGFSRTYPNLLTQEGIRGNEEMPDAVHNTILPFTRFLAGAADYTPCYFNGRVKNTKAHQLAMAAVYYSPLQFLFWYDNPTLYRGEEELEFWKAIPTVWDDSRALDGEIGEYIVQARRSGNEWFVGAMTNTEARTITVTTDFLKSGTKYVLNLYEDDDSLNTRTKVRTTHKRIKAGDKLVLSLKASGGAAMHFIPVLK